MPQEDEILKTNYARTNAPKFCVFNIAFFLHKYCRSEIISGSSDKKKNTAGEVIESLQAAYPPSVTSGFGSQVGRALASNASTRQVRIQEEHGRSNFKIDFITKPGG